MSQRGSAATTLRVGLLAPLIALLLLSGCVTRGPVRSDNSCALLEVTNVNARGTLRGVIYTVANRSNEQRQFAIYRAGVESTRFTIEAGETKEVGVAAGIATRAIGGAWATVHGQGGAASLVNCTPPSTEAIEASQTGATSVVESASATTADIGGTTVRATGSVNMRAGPGTRHAVLGSLRPGDEVVVLRVDGSWCECMTNGQVRFFVNCRYLSLPAGGWARFGRGSEGTLAGWRTTFATPVAEIEGLTQRLVRGTYSQARRQLTAGDWRPHEMSIRVCPSHLPQCRTYSELVACAATGVSRCAYVWRRGSDYLIIVAVGAESDQEVAQLQLCGGIRNSRDEPYPECGNTPSEFSTIVSNANTVVSVLESPEYLAVQRDMRESCSSAGGQPQGLIADGSFIGDINRDGIDDVMISSSGFICVYPGSEQWFTLPEPFCLGGRGRVGHDVSDCRSWLIVSQPNNQFRVAWTEVGGGLSVFDRNGPVWLGRGRNCRARLYSTCEMLWNGRTLVPSGRYSQ